MNSLIEEASRFQQFVTEKGWPFYFVGEIAVQVWGEPRLTSDIDLHVFTELRNEPSFIAENEYFPYLPLTASRSM